MKGFRRPSTGTALGFIALLVALGGTAFAATGQIVNIADGTNAARIAKVDSQGRLDVGDGTGPMTVDGSVAPQDPPASFVRLSGGFVDNPPCAVIGTPPGNKAWVIRTIGLDAFDTGAVSYNGSYHVTLYTDAGCTQAFDDIEVRGPGHHELAYNPGIIVPKGGALAALGEMPPSGTGVEVFAQGVAVAASSVPASANVTGALTRRR